MNRLIKILSTIGMLCCLPFLYILFLQPNLLKDFSRSYLNHRISPKAQSLAEIAQAKGLPLLIDVKAPQEMIDLVREHSERCLNDPYLYVSTITADDSIDLAKQKAIANPFLKKLIPQDLFFFDAIKQHFQESYRNLLNDLRIFFCTNFIGLLSTLSLLWRVPSSHRLNVPAYLILVSLIHSSSTYFDQSFFFNFLLDSHMGFWYPVLVLITLIRLFLKRKTKAFKREVNSTLNEAIENTIS